MTKPAYTTNAQENTFLGWFAGPVLDKDKSRPARVQAVQPAHPHTAYPKADVKSVPLRAECSQHGDALHSTCTALAVVTLHLLFCIYSFSQQPKQKAERQFVVVHMSSSSL